MNSNINSIVEIKCPICGKAFKDSSGLVEHLESSHYQSYQECCENVLSSDIPINTNCFNCSSTRPCLTWLEPDFYYLPCWRCMTKKPDLRVANEEIQRNIKSFYRKIIGDRYFQLFILDDIYISSTVPHQYDTFKSVLKLLPLPKDRDDLWFLDWYIGFPRVINKDNVSGIKVVNLTKNFQNCKGSKGENCIIVGEYNIEFPEQVPYSQKRYSRYNLFNPNGERLTKRLRIQSQSGEGDWSCVKFFNDPKHPDWKRIFNITKCGKSVSVSDIPRIDLLLIKMAIFRSNQALKLIFDIIQEILKKTGHFGDKVFLKNSLTIDPNNDTEFNLNWYSTEKQKDNLKNLIINISIL